jgi:cell wall-associated NlpC family hydrolase
MRPIRLLILLLAIALALVLSLLRPIQGRAGRGHGRPVVAMKMADVAPLRRRHLMSVPATPREALGRRVVSYARHLLGIRYSWGGTSPRTGFDCSGLVRYVYGHFGISLPHSSWADLGLGHRVSRRWLQPGDLVFFAGASHVGIYAGSGRFIDAPHSGAVVRVTTMRDSWYSGSYYGARRFRG